MTFSFALGACAGEPDGAVDTAVPLIGGDPLEAIASEASPAGREGAFTLWRGPEGLVGVARADPHGDLEAAARNVYSELLRSARGMNLYRIWNFVPRINERPPGSLENYQAFCRGRSLAFESALGADFPGALPAASAVGAADPRLTIVFLAGPAPARHFENPAQIPAYSYPPEHGPRPPSFSRATRVERPGGLDVYVSGTSSIVGHSTVRPNDTAGQLDCTLENLVRICRACGLGDSLDAGRAGARHFKVYLRNPGDLTSVSREMDLRVLGGADRVSYLCAGICRSELNVEIEVAVRGAPSS